MLAASALVWGSLGARHALGRWPRARPAREGGWGTTRHPLTRVTSGGRPVPRAGRRRTWSVLRWEEEGGDEEEEEEACECGGVTGGPAGYLVQLDDGWP